MLVRNVYRAGEIGARAVAACTLLGVAVLADVDGFRGSLLSSLSTAGWGLAVLFPGSLAAVVVHEAGHALACLALGSKIYGIRLGSDAPNRRRFGVGKLAVSLSWLFNGEVESGGTPSRGRNALIIAAGSLANLMAAGALLAAFGLNDWRAVGLALIMAGNGLCSLLPFRARNGRLSDGANLLAVVGGQIAGEAFTTRDADDSPSADHGAPQSAG